MPDLHPFNGRVSRHFGRLAPDDAYLSYYDVRLTKEDITVLRSDWLTDNVISFWEEYLEREFLSAYRHSHIVLLRPTMSFMLLQTPDPSKIKDALPDFSHTTHVFLPINDCSSVTVAEGGTHWSLLLISIVDRVAFHYDSLPPGNRREAHMVTTRFSQLLGLDKNGGGGGSSRGGGSGIRFVQLADAPVQENSSDCGVFVCLNMRHLLLKRLLMVRTDEKVSMSLGARRVDAREGRREMLRIIEGFRREGERRRHRSDSSTSPHPARKSRTPPRIDSPIGSQTGSPVSSHANGSSGSSNSNSNSNPSGDPHRHRIH